MNYLDIYKKNLIRHNQKKLLQDDIPENQLRKKITKLTNENAFDEYLEKKGFEKKY